MIAHIKGIITNKQVPYVIVDVNGIGYEVQLSTSSFLALPEVGEKIDLVTHFVVREDAQLLYGFVTDTERSLFRSLIKVNGIGPKLALTILSGISPESFVQCIHDGDHASLLQISGVGKKMAERLIIEMRDKLIHWHPDLEVSSKTNNMTSSVNEARTLTREAVSALVSLGYKPQQASLIIAKIEADANTPLSVEELIRRALKGMVTHD